MPHINRIRVNNVKYNFGTQFYDDFLMRFSGKNTIYDLANGGGKSVLMLLLLQNMIPNCTLDDKQPIEKLFRTNEGSTTIHSLIEWELSDAHIRDGFRYMLTGFCARKAKDSAEVEENRNSAAIEYYNYCIFYRKYNENDIKNLPLEKNGEKVTYTGLKNYLKELERGNYHLEVHIFERKGDYQKFIADYGIYESEWEIIRGINKTEGHVRAYFENNYKTTRKVVEDLLIEEIIEKSFRNKYAAVGERQSGLAETLLNIKDKLLELSRKREEIQNYDRQIVIIDGFVERLQSICQMYNSINKNFVQIQQLFNTLQMQEAQVHIEKETAAKERLQCMKDKNELAKKVETARVLVDMEQMQEVEVRLEEENAVLEKLKEDMTELQKTLTEWECGNYYLEYADSKKEYDILKQVIVNLQADHSTLENQLQNFLEMKKHYDTIRKQKILEGMAEKTTECEAVKARLEAYQEQQRVVAKELAVLEYSFEQLKKQLEVIKTEVQERKKDTNLLMLTGIPQELAKVQKQVAAIEEKQEHLQQQLVQCKNDQLERRIRLEGVRNELAEVVAAISSAEERKKERRLSEEKKKTLMHVYDESNLERLIQKIMEQKNASVISCEELRKEIEQKKRRFKMLEEGRTATESESLLKVLQYINKYHGTVAVTGQAYLAELDMDRRRELCKQLPVLPYAIVVREKFQEVCFDNRLSELITGEEYLVLFDEATMEHQHQVLYLAGEQMLFDEKQQEIYRKQLKQELEELEKQHRRRLENEVILQEDYIFLLTLQQNLVSDSDMPELKRKQLEEQQTVWKVELETLKQQQFHLEETLESCVAERKSLKEEEEGLSALANCLQQESQITKAHADAEELLGHKKQEYYQIFRQVEGEEEKLQTASQHLTNLKQECTELEENWKQKYAIFYKEQADTSVQNEYKQYSAEAVDVQLDALLESMKKEHASVADKEKLLQNYGQMMERALGRICYLSETPEKYQERFEMQQLMKHNTEDLSKKKKEISEKNQRIEEKKALIAKISSERDQLQGKITHGVSAISKKYGYFDAEMIERYEVLTFLNENDVLLSSIEEHMEEQNQILKRLEEKSIALQVLKKETENLMQRGSIQSDSEVGYMKPNVDLKAEWNRLNGCFDGYIDERYRRAREFQEELGMLVDTLEKLKAQALAQEIKTHIHMPESVQEAEVLIQSLVETNQFIQLEKDRVLQGLEDMQMMKENFENQCIQTCVNIRTELERLDKLSKITMDDELISMIQLKIPYVKEEQYQTRMTEYIDQIAKATDGFEKEEDKLKYLRNNLCWKRLFSVIVSDMNGIRMNLYKRERISKQSRYLPYEEAVGSTGQSQGIYIQFLVSIINYISSIHSKQADAGRLKKTIFIDNPFGAAKDVYIWEPIFKLLKTNNVQLVVPARGVTPAITGRFDVNYILGQKLQDGRQQTVVVEYYSNVASGELEYTNFEYEQTSLF